MTAEFHKTKRVLKVMLYSSVVHQRKNAGHFGKLKRLYQKQHGISHCQQNKKKKNSLRIVEFACRVDRMVQRDATIGLTVNGKRPLLHLCGICFLSLSELVK
jgi:hypothetical protein